MTTDVFEVNAEAAVHFDDGIAVERRRVLELVSYVRSYVAACTSEQYICDVLESYISEQTQVL